MPESLRSMKVAITGIGAICGLGQSKDQIWEAALAGRSGISTFSLFDTSDLPVQFGGEVKGFSLAEEIMPEKEAKRYDRFIHLALHAAHEAMGDAGMREKLPYDAQRIGVILGVGMGGLPVIEENCRILFEKGAKRISPFFIPATIPNMASGLISIRYGLKGTNFSIASACASSGHAIAAAAMEILMGNHDIVVTGGAESTISTLPLAGFANMKALSKWNEKPEKASRPFDRDRNGFVMGEGSTIFILENYEKAKARGAKIYGELVGFGSSSDCFHITAPHEEGEGAVSCMQKAIQMAGIEPEQVGYINAHGTSTPLGDIAETKAIKKTFGEHAYHLLVSSTKSMTGHLLGAAGALESFFCIKALETGSVPPTINLDNADAECDLNYVPHEPVRANPQYALNNSFGFGGTNSSLIFKKSDS